MSVDALWLTQIFFYLFLLKFEVAFYFSPWFQAVYNEVYKTAEVYSLEVFYEIWSLSFVFFLFVMPTNH